MDIDLIKAKVLDLAIKGQLVEQRDDEKLSDEILALPNIEISFEIPNNWKNIPFAKIIVLISGRDLDKNSIYNIPTKTPYITGASQFNNDKLIINRWTNNPLVLSTINDLLITCKGTIGEIAFNNIGDIHIARQVMAIRPLKDIFITNKFCKLIIKQNINYLQKKSKGLIPGITRNDILNINVALPPLQEQTRIIKKVEEIFSILDNLKDHQTSLLSKLDLIRKVAIDKAIKGQLVEQREDEKLSDEILTLPNIEGPFEIPKNWKWITLANIGYGNVSQIKNENIKSGTWILELEDIGKHTGKILRKNYLKDGKTKSTKNIFKKGDVLYSKLRPYLNKVVIADEDGVCSSEIIPINLSKSNFEFLAQFLQLVLMSPYFVSYASSVSYGVKMPRLGTKDGKQALIPYPPLQEQNRIVQKLEEILSTVSTIENLLKSDKT